jgi:hypothetical protein
MAGRPHRNLELCDCVGLQFAKTRGQNELMLEDVELLIPAAKNQSFTWDQFKSMASERIIKDKWEIHSCVYRDEVGKRSWYIDNEAKFALFCRASMRNNEVPVFTVLVKPVMKPAEEEKKEEAK